MLKLLIVTSGLFVSSCADVDFSFSKTCFSEGGDLELSAKYTGSGTVTAVQWYYSGQVGGNLIVLASTCAILGAPDPGYPDTSRMNFTCPATNTFTLTLKGLLEDELKKSWGATFSLSSGSSPTTAQEPIQICTASTTTSSTTSTTTCTTTTTTSPASTTTTTPSTTTTTTTSITPTTTTPSTTRTTPASTTSIMPITTTFMRMPITTSIPSTTSTTLTSKSTSSTKSSNEGLSNEMIIVIVVVPVGVLAVAGTVIFFFFFYRERKGKRKPTSHKRHKRYKDNMRPVQQHQQQPYILYGRGRKEELNHKETKRSRSLHNDDRYNWYDGYHWGSQVKQNPVYKGDRNLGRLYYNESLPRYDDYRSGYKKGHVYPSHISGYHYRPDYHGDNRGHENRQHSSYPVYSRQQEYIDPSYSYMGY